MSESAAQDRLVKERVALAAPNLPRIRELETALARSCECDAPRCEREGCQDKPMPSAASTGSELDGFGAASGRALNTAGSSAPPGSDSTAAQMPDEELIREAKDRIARVVVALQDGSRPALERLAHEALDLLHQVTA